HRPDFNQQMWMRQLGPGHSGTSRPIAAEVLAIHVVVSREIVHAYEVRRYFHNIFELRALTFQNVAHVLNHGLRLRSNVEMLRPKLVHFRPGNRVVGTACARPRHKEKIARALHMRILAPGLRLPRNHLASNFPHISDPPARTFTAECKYCSVRNRNSVSACRLRVRSPKVLLHQMASSNRGGTSNSPR